MWNQQARPKGDIFTNDTDQPLTVTRISVEPQSAEPFVHWYVLDEDGTPLEDRPAPAFIVKTGLRLMFSVTHDESLAGDDEVLSVRVTSVDETGHEETVYAY